MGLKFVQAKSVSKETNKRFIVATVRDSNRMITDVLLNDNEKFSPRPCFEIHGNNVEHELVPLDTAFEMIQKNEIAHCSYSDGDVVTTYERKRLVGGLEAFPTLYSKSYEFFTKVPNSCALVPIRLGTSDMLITDEFARESNEATIDVLVLCKDLMNYLRATKLWLNFVKKIGDKMVGDSQNLLREAGKDAMFLYGLSFQTFDKLLHADGFTVSADPLWVLNQIRFKKLRNEVVFGSADSTRIGTYEEFRKLYDTITDNISNVYSAKTVKSNNTAFGPNTQEYIKKFQMTEEQFMEDSERLMKLTGTNNLEELEKEIVTFI